MDCHTKLILLKLADHANDDGQCYPSVRRIVDETGISRTCVMERMRTLEHLGVVIRKQRKEETTLYTVIPENWPEPSTDVQPHSPPRAPGAPPPCAPRTPPVRRAHPNHHRTINEPSKVFPSPATAELFEISAPDPAPSPEPTAEAIYQAYPKHLDRKAALKAIAAALKKITASELLAKVQSYALSRKGEDAKFTPYPATWFNAERWNDIHETTKNDESKPYLDWGTA